MRSAPTALPTIAPRIPSSSLRPRASHAGRLGLVTLLALVAACQQSSPPPAPLSVATPTQGSSATAPLPRQIADIQLGATRDQIEARLGPLDCHDGEGGLQVCSATNPSAVRELQLYLFEDRGVSITYEIEPPANAWTFLDQQIAKYGRPSLSSQRSRDKIGRDHEVFGWKDADSLYSVRFIWGPDVQSDRKLLNTVIALWDRPAYQAWEKASQAGNE